MSYKIMPSMCIFNFRRTYQNIKYCLTAGQNLCTNELKSLIILILVLQKSCFSTILHDLKQYTENIA